jgi:hypothetical protein
MATSRAFKYNPSGSTIYGTIQVGSVSVASDTIDDFGNGGWWNGPDEDLGYVICLPVPLDNQDTPVPGDDLILDPAFTGPGQTDITLSNNNQTATQVFSYQQSVLGSTVIQGTDKVMFSVKFTSTQPGVSVGTRVIGVGRPSMNYQGNPFGGYPGNDNQSNGFSDDGQYYSNGSGTTNYPTWTSGDIIDIAVDHGQLRLWIRVNGGNWNNNASANPTSNSGGVATIAGLINFRPVLCPSIYGTMEILNTPKYGYPTGFNFLGHTTASVKFVRSSNLTQESFVDLVNSRFNQTFTTGNGANSFLTTTGYWSSWTGFGSSGFQWMTMNSISSSTASGVGQNAITVSITQTGGGMAIENGMYSASTFPAQYGVPLTGDQIQNNNSGTFTAVFSQPVYNALVAFASVGNPSLGVPVVVSVPFTPIFSQDTTYQYPVGTQSQYTQFTGTEGFNIIRIDGTASSVSFNYTVSETYSTICFGFVDQN